MDTFITENDLAIFERNRRRAIYTFSNADRDSHSMDCVTINFLMARAARFGTSIAQQVTFDIDMELRHDEKICIV